MSKPVLLWVDLTVGGSDLELRRRFEERCCVRSTAADGDGGAGTPPAAPDFVFLEYDYPDKRSLAVLQRTKRLRPSVPVVMITLARSEALAVWAFRAGAWDYLARPVTGEEIERVCLRLQQLVDERPRQSTRQPTLGAAEPPRETQYCAPPGPDRSMTPAVAFVQANFGDKISEKQVADACGMSTFRFSRAFHEHFGTTFRQWLLTYRLAQSRRLLGNPHYTVTQVAFMSGFGDASHFGRMFRREYDMTPTEFRDALAAGDADAILAPLPAEAALRGAGDAGDGQFAALPLHRFADLP